MKLLIMTGPLYPHPGNNANLIGKLIPFFLSAGHEVHLFSTAFGENENNLPKECFGVPVHWVTDWKRDWKRKLVYPLISKVTDPNGFSDALQVQIIMQELKEVCKKFPVEATLSTSEPYTMACVAARLYGGKKALYIMDPPACISKGAETAFRNRNLPSVLENHSALITTPFIMKALKEAKLPLPNRVSTVGFPLITENSPVQEKKTDEKIRILFSGWLYSDIRSPKYFLNIIARLDERFEVTFMGRECEKLLERFPTETKATIITLSHQPYDIALKAIADTDVLINIGNSVPVHMPSKMLEYINTGKPIVNFYKIADCPTLHYTKRYPLALNLFEEEKDLSISTEQFLRFCEESIGKTIDHDWIKTEFADCTPRYIAQKIIESLEK